MSKKWSESEEQVAMFGPTSGESLAHESQKSYQLILRSVTMAIPTYEKFMYPLLGCLKDRQEHTLSELNESLIEHFNLTKEDLKEMIPSGKKSLFGNRFGWARTYLKNAGLIESPRRTVFRITDRGLSIINDPTITYINDSVLKQFPEYLAFKKGSSSSADNQIEAANTDTSKTPLELLTENYSLIKQAVQEEILEKIMNNTPQFFEQLIVDLVVAMGYGGSVADAGKAVGKSGDGGIDGVIKEDILGLDKIYLQGKRWSNPVSRPDIQAFVGSLVGFKANKGIFITTSRFTKEAFDYAEGIDKSLILIDGQRLTDLLFEFNVGVSNEQTFTIKRIDLDYFEEM
ncbi:restriction endonuclease [Solibacillus sp. FSL K6-1554]|uniref:restriction endonuclease n=1 Tax=Solibacillus sp. FSL K6-1554 TaxID=2921472 RepID=UPI0030F512B2